MFSKEAYKAHLASDYWREFKEQYRPKYCQWPAGCLSFPTDGHHLTYQHFGREKEFPRDIAFYCRRHHDVVHFNAFGQRRKNWRQYNHGGTSSTPVPIPVILTLLLLAITFFFLVFRYILFP